MRRLVAILLVAFPVAAFAAPPTPEQLDRLLVAMDSQKQVELMQQAMGPMMRSAMEQMTKARPITPEQQATLDRMTAKAGALVREQLSWEQMRPMLLQIYGETFDAGEVEGLITFYESPTGRAFVAKMPMVMQKSMAINQQRMQGLMRSMQDSLKESMGDR